MNTTLASKAAAERVQWLRKSNNLEREKKRQREGNRDRKKDEKRQREGRDRAKTDQEVQQLRESNS